MYFNIHSGFSTDSPNDATAPGSYIINSTCYARNEVSNSGVYAFARCCNFNQLSTTCTTYVSDTSSNQDDAKVYISCQSSDELIMGWYTNTFLYF